MTQPTLTAASLIELRTAQQRGEEPARPIIVHDLALVGGPERSVMFDPNRVDPAVVVRTVGNTPFFIDKSICYNPTRTRCSGGISWSRRKALVRHGPRAAGMAPFEKPAELPRGKPSNKVRVFGLRVGLFRPSGGPWGHAPYSRRSFGSPSCSRPNPVGHETSREPAPS